MPNTEVTAKKSGSEKFKDIMGKTGFVLKLTAKWAYQLRSLLLSIPVFVCAAALAIRNIRLLPESVGIGLLVSGDYQFYVVRGIAALLPLVVTCICIVLMLCSKKMLYPWLVSLLSLVLPWAIWFSSTFPA